MFKFAISFISLMASLWSLQLHEETDNSYIAHIYNNIESNYDKFNHKGSYPTYLELDFENTYHQRVFKRFLKSEFHKPKSFGIKFKISNSNSKTEYVIRQSAFYNSKSLTYVKIDSKGLIYDCNGDADCTSVKVKRQLHNYSVKTEQIDSLFLGPYNQICVEKLIIKKWKLSKQQSNTDTLIYEAYVIPSKVSFVQQVIDIDTSISNFSVPKFKVYYSSSPQDYETFEIGDITSIGIYK